MQTERHSVVVVGWKSTTSVSLQYHHHFSIHPLSPERKHAVTGTPSMEVDSPRFTRIFSQIPQTPGGASRSPHKRSVLRACSRARPEEPKAKPKPKPKPKEATFCGQTGGVAGISLSKLGFEHRSSSCLGTFLFYFVELI